MSAVAWEWVGRKWVRVLPAGSLRSRIILGTFWTLLGAVVSQALILLASVLTARLLGQVVFGELGIINSTVGMFGVFAGVGLGTTATKYLAELRSTDPERAGRILGLCTSMALVSGGVTSLVLFALSPFLAARTLNSPQLGFELQLGCGLLFFNALNGAQVGILSGFEAFRTVAWVNLVKGLINLPAVFVGAMLLKLPGAVGAMVLVSAVGCLFNHLALRSKCRHGGIRVSYRGVRAELGVFWKFSIPSFLTGVIVVPVMWVANTMLVNQPNGYAQMGVFNAASQWRMAILFIPSAIGTVSLPMLSNLYGLDEKSRHLKLLWSNLLLVLGVALLVAIPVIVASPWIMSLYGSEFLRGHWVLNLMAVSCVFMAGNSLIGNGIISVGAIWWGFTFNLLWAVTFLTVWGLLISQGAVGLAVAYVISYVAHSVWQAAYLMLLQRRAR
jgi:O-antigen/teichoic acid export membrane protein